MFNSPGAPSLARPVVEPLPPDTVIFGASNHMQGIRSRLDKLASTSVPILIEGESGTGKDILARCIHLRSPWYSGPFVKVNCPAIPGTLIESELFGYERGSFTGANSAKPGQVELAQWGTLFLDEISELDISLQAKLLQFLQDGRFSRLGSQVDRSVDMRLVCATNRVLAQEVESGAFRRDLYYRVNVVKISLPALRERAADIATIARYYVEHYNIKYNCRTQFLSEDCLYQMQLYSWPGNIRQLENIMRRYVLMQSEDAILSELTQPSMGGVSIDIPRDQPMSLKRVTREAADEVERKIIFAALEASGWNRKRAARALSISYRALLYKLRAFGVPPDRQHQPRALPAAAGHND